MIHPIECGPNVVYFALSVVMFTMAQSGSTKIEAQHGESETVQRLHGMKHYLVVKRSAVERVGMANNSSIGGVGEFQR